MKIKKIILENWKKIIFGGLVGLTLAMVFTIVPPIIVSLKPHWVVAILLFMWTIFIILIGKGV